MGNPTCARLARFFGITVDELLGAEQIDEKKLQEEYEARAVEIYRNGDISKTLPIWQEAYHKLPNNIEVKEMLMSIYYDIDKIKYQKEIVELGTEIYNSKQIEIPFFLYCSRLLQSYQGGQYYFG